MTCVVGRLPSWSSFRRLSGRATVRNTTKLPIESASAYTGYGQRILREAVKRGELAAERPGGFERARLYFATDELDRWMAAIAVGKK